MKFTIALLFVSLAISTFSQSSEQKIPRKTAKDVTLLANYLTRNIRSKDKKVEAIYEWITHNIAYDYAALEKGTYSILSDPNQTLKSKKAMNAGYAELMKAMLDAIKIENETISGYMHDMHWFPGKLVTEEGHTWIAVKLNGEWQLADPTWDAGYIGRIPKNIKPYQPKKHLKNQWKKPEKALKKEEKREKNELARKKKYDEKPAYSNKIGFVADPTKDFLFLHKDSFLLRHAPTLPMWQLRRNVISLESYSQSRDTLRMDIQANKGERIDPDKEIENFKELDFLQQLLYHGEAGYRYNPHNPWIKALYYYDFMAIIHSKSLQKLARGSIYEIDESKYWALASFSDTILNYCKLFKGSEKEGNTANKLFDKEQYKLSAERDKVNAKLTKQVTNEFDKLEDKLKSNSALLEKNLDRLKTVKEKIRMDYAKAIDYSVPEDMDTNVIEPTLHLIRERTNKINMRIADLNTRRAQSSFNGLFQAANYIEQLLLENEHYIRVNSYSTVEWVTEIDSLVKKEANRYLAITKDSIPFELLEKELLDELRVIEEICKVAKADLNQLKEENKIKYPYKYELYLQAKLVEAIQEVEQAHYQSLNFNQVVAKAIKSEKSNVSQIDSRMKKQPDLKKKNHEYIAKMTEKEHERKVNYTEMMVKSAKSWKQKYSKK
ncbi:MAG: transglutaminase-like domain-containing protein [Crocinitomicaceae bacterium]